MDDARLIRGAILLKKGTTLLAETAKSPAGGL